MRNMSFMLTTKQFINKTKTVTRRNGWKHIKIGDFIQGCEKCQGLKKGEKINKLSTIQILKTEFVPLNTITKSDCIKEGFPDMTPAEFVAFYCKHNKCKPTDLVNRIEFVHVVKTDNYTLYNGDCFDILPLIAPDSVDLTLSDMPYNITHNTWETRIPMNDYVIDEKNQPQGYKDFYIYMSRYGATYDEIKAMWDKYHIKGLWHQLNRVNKVRTATLLTASSPGFINYLFNSNTHRPCGSTRPSTPDTTPAPRAPATSRWSV